MSGFERQPLLRGVEPFFDATIRRRVKQGKFSAPVKLSERVTA
jgi:hypothetical protein